MSGKKGDVGLADEQLTFRTIYRHIGRRVYLLILFTFGVLLLILILLWRQQALVSHTSRQVNNTGVQLANYSTAVLRLSEASADKPAITPTFSEQPFDQTQALTLLNYAFYLEGLYVKPADQPAPGDIAGSFDNGLTLNADSVALGLDTTGNYLAGLLAGSGLNVTGGGSEGATPTVTLDSSLAMFKTIDASLGTDPAADSLTDSLSLNSGDGITVTGDATTDAVTFNLNLAGGGGLMIDGAALSLLNTCGDGQYLAWNDTGSTWQCTSLTAAPNLFMTMSGDSGSSMADNTTDTLTFVGGDGLTSTASDLSDTVTFTVDLASGSGLAFSGGALTLQSCSDGQILKQASGAWVCSPGNTTALASAYRQHLAGADNVSLTSTPAPLLTNGSGTPLRLSITINSGNEVALVATVETSTSLATGPGTFFLVRDDNQDNDCVTGGGDGTQIGGQISNFIASTVTSSTATLSFVDTAPGATTVSYQLCGSTTIVLGTATITDRSLILQEINL